MRSCKLKIELEKRDVGRYKSLMGALIYLTHTKPDITFSVGVVSKSMHSLTKHYYGAIKRICSTLLEPLSMKFGIQRI